jgi:hypothetical protein
MMFVARSAALVALAVLGISAPSAPLGPYPDAAAFRQDAPRPAEASPGAPASRSAQSAEEFLVAHPECQAISDGCFMCYRTATGSECTPAAFACVSRGFACNP